MNYSKVIAIIFLTIYSVFSGVSFAQSNGQGWSLEAENSTMPRKGFGSFENQPQAVSWIPNIPGVQPNAGDLYSYVKYVRKVTPKPNGLTEITYWMGKTQPLDPDWTYYLGGITYSEEDATELIRSAYDPVPACASYGAAVATPTSDWYALFTGMEGRYEGKSLSISTFEYEDVGICSSVTYQQTLIRMRRLQCPVPYTQWNDDEQGCVNLDAFAYVTGTNLQCDGGSGNSGYVGNPCDVKTGDKTQPELDLDLGWMSLLRTYHSTSSMRNGGFGTGWTHNHQIALVFGTGVAQIVSGSGFSKTFAETDGKFVATDSSGDTLQARGAGWVLNSGSSTTSFDSAGRSTRIDYETGKFIEYDYDEIGRLESVRNYDGRELSFNYASDSEASSIASVSLGGAQLASYTYNELGQVASVTYADGSSRGYHYEETDNPNNLTGVTDEEGQRFSTFTYDSSGKVVSSSHAGGAQGVSLSYASGSTVVTDSLGNETTYTISSNSSGVPSISAVSDSRGTTAYTRFSAGADARQRLSSVTDPMGVVTKHAYGEITDSGVVENVHTMQEAFGLPEQRTTITRTEVESNRILSVQFDRLLVDYTRNARLQPTSITSTNLDTSGARIATLSYCEDADVTATGSNCPILGLLKAFDGPRTDVNDLTQYAYFGSDDMGCGMAGSGSCAHRKGDLWKVIDAFGHVTETLAYDGAGRPLSVKDPNGVITDYEYHPRGWLTATKVRGADSSTESDDRITRIDYWPTGLVKRVTQPDGAFTAYTYDAAHRLTDVSDNAGNTIHYTLDNAGNRIAEDTKDANGNLKRTLSRVYNQLGQLATQADAVGNPTDYGYDANGNATSATDALSRVTQSEYDPLNRLKRTLQDVGGIAAETKLAYDALDRLTEVTDPKGLKTTYNYSAWGDLTQQVSPDSGSTTYTYDSAGNRVTQTDAENRAATYVYDALNRLTGISYATPALDVAYTYDVTEDVCSVDETFSTGRLTKMQDGSGTTQYCYNRFGDLTRKVQTVNGVALTLRYSYAPGGQLTAMTYPDGAVVDYVRDSQGRITEVGVKPSAGARQVLLTGATYHPFGPAAGWTYGNGRQMTRTLDLDYRPAAIHDASTGGLAVGFNYDEVGNLVELTQPGSTLPQVGLGYDALGRLTQFKDGPTGTVIDGYGYDKTGNRISLSTAAGTSTYSYPTTSHRLTNVGGIARTYDAAGNTTAINGTAKQFVYDDTGRMSSVKAGGITTRNYQYNGKGERVRSYLSTANTYTLYDEAGHWVGDYGANGTPVQQAIWMDDLPVGLRAAAASTVSYIEPDHLGSPRAVIDPVANTAIWKWDIKGEAFGATAPEQDPDGNGTAFNLDMRFPGQRYDQYTGLSYNYFRDYEPGTGRYSQSDPIGLRGGMSTYSYAEGNPISGLDPLGLTGERVKAEPVPQTPQMAAAASRLQGLANSAARNVDATCGIRCSLPWIRGTLIHSEFKRLVDTTCPSAQYATEVSYKDGQVVPYGTWGSSRADVIFGQTGAPTAVYDLKTGWAYISQGQAQAYYQNLPPGTPILVIRPDGR
ncbi:MULTISPECIES: RHS repeat-associated core domain-containing protein [Pseudoxanthomonas]|uniref:RHS repeat-associated protein n=1 Tax=Pseudoxanthomonas winnipegensis TaxID=2480810 RepID=A0AAW8G691_9GAMM|nr:MULTISPECIES: RHS repeat-associated core domain-containing protein [Pseudoxanthomonas]MDQ1117929.1 RHS repeat-associated protein [Pseudoxanthomonas winnipegensis]MDQ1134898.1 RHS repeat-associated protein [Pseudoxanthomonas winnipegensis]MDR6138869.1 RHS repeat-associated protein [Pseudoxanthomonas sp. SORGH_AS_0997]